MSTFITFVNSSKLEKKTIKKKIYFVKMVIKYIFGENSNP